MAKHPFRNDGHARLSTPGFGHIPINLELQQGERFTHGTIEWEEQPNITVRELDMLKLMDAITEKLSWHVDVFKSEVISMWREEALKMPLINDKAWDWCLAELQDKAVFFKQTGRILVFNIGSGISKSQTLISSKLQAELRHGVAPLLALPEVEKDWHPNFHRQVLNLVHPSLFPLVYGRTHVLIDGGQVDLFGFLNSCGRGTLAPKYPDEHLDRSAASRRDNNRAGNSSRVFNNYPFCQWSERFQWLPCEVEFTGETNTSVRITSYINNLHPVRFKSMYSAIEKLISHVVEPWNDILIKGGRGRWPMRIRTWGVEWLPKPPEWSHPKHLIELEKDRASDAFKNAVHQIKQFIALPEDHPNKPNYEGPRRLFPLVPEILANWEEADGGLNLVVQEKLNRLCHWQHPEPGTAFTYEQWKLGQTAKAIVNSNRTKLSHFWDSDHDFQSVKLQDTFREQGLQIIVKIASIELTPDEPTFPGEKWHIEGMLNEHIVATAIYYYDVENVTETRIAFRQNIEMEPEQFVYLSDDLEPLMAIFAEPSIDQLPYLSMRSSPSPTCELGSVATPGGRLLAWPNTLQHRIEPFELADRTTKGHQRFIVLWLVDPHYRVSSTRNVPPQRHDWWAEEAIKHVGLANSGLSQELLDMIDKATDEWPMGLEEAKTLRLEMTEERTKLDNYLTGLEA